jgi:hypothetical protein
MNAGTIIRTIFVVAVCLNDALLMTDVAQFENPTVDLAYQIASVILNFVVVACSHYYNNDFTPEASIGTGYTRMLKAQKQAGYIGEAYFDDEEECFEDMDSEEDEEDEQEDFPTV